MGFFLGIDIGTTKAAVVVYEPDTGSLLAAASQATRAACPVPLPGADEQNPNSIISVLQKLCAKIPAELLSSIEGIGITGQMHGVTLRKDDGSLSNLITWRDRRASFDGSLPKLAAKPGCSGLSDGFGLTSLAWLASKKLLTSEWVAAATIQDILAMELCGLTRPMTDYCDAASWGLFDLQKIDWNRKAIKALDIPERLLPDLRPPGAKAGFLCRKWAKKLRLEAGTPVMVATGDNQASLFATEKNPERELYLTVGTGAQLSIVLSEEEAFSRPLPKGVELRPYFGGRVIVVSATLCGGESFAWLVKSMHGVLRDFGVSIPKETETYKRLDELAMRSLNSGLRFSPSFIGERHDHSLRGSINGMRLDNFNAGALAASMAEGIFRNMKELMPAWAFEGRDRIIASGNALRRLLILQTQARRIFKVPLTIPETCEEAACGAAKLAAQV